MPGNVIVPGRTINHTGITGWLQHRTPGTLPRKRWDTLNT